FAIYSEQFFAAVIANLANLAGTSVASVLRTLSEQFNIELNNASKFITDAGYKLQSWVIGVGTGINKGLAFLWVVEISNRGGFYDLVLENAGIGHGNWVVAPPARIVRGAAG